MKRSVAGIMALALALCGAGHARADLVYTVNDSAHSLNVTVDFKITQDNQGTPTGIELVVTNNSSVDDSAHSVSYITFSVGGTHLTVPTGITQLSGDEVNFTHVTGNTYTSSDIGTVSYTSFTGNDPHWFFTTSGGTVNLGNVNSGTGNPHEMIIAGTNVSSDVSTFDPYFNQTANFFLAASLAPTSPGLYTLSSADITGLTLKFGTGPEYSPPASDSSSSGTTTIDPPVAAPEPTTLVGVLTALPVTGYWWLRWRRGRTRTAA
jgi:hypothetical protein